MVNCPDWTQLTETPERSDRQIAVGLGVSHTTVMRNREKMESIGALHQSTNRETSDGRTYPATRKPVSLFNPTPREEKAVLDPLAP